jgi:hypothetical protein
MKSARRRKAGLAQGCAVLIIRRGLNSARFDSGAMAPKWTTRSRILVSIRLVGEDYAASPAPESRWDPATEPRTAQPWAPGDFAPDKMPRTIEWKSLTGTYCRNP